MPLAMPASMGPSALPTGTLEASFLDALPGKNPLIKRTFRPPNYETPVAYFNDLYTPNDAFFVRYHIVNIPGVAAASWKLRIGGEALQKPMELSLDDLKRGFERVELPALCMCAGNRRGLFQPHVPGGGREGGCIVWGGSVRLSPADDILIRVERPLDLDSDGQARVRAGRGTFWTMAARGENSRLSARPRAACARRRWRRIRTR